MIRMFFKHIPNKVYHRSGYYDKYNEKRNAFIKNFKKTIKTVANRNLKKSYPFSSFKFMMSIKSKAFIGCKHVYANW